MLQPHRVLDLAACIIAASLSRGPGIGSTVEGLRMHTVQSSVIGIKTMAPGTSIEYGTLGYKTKDEPNRPTWGLPLKDDKTSKVSANSKCTLLLSSMEGCLLVHCWCLKDGCISCSLCFQATMVGGQLSIDTVVHQTSLLLPLDVVIPSVLGEPPVPCHRKS